MRAFFLALIPAALVAAGAYLLAPSTAAEPREAPAARKASGIERRVPWTTSKLVGSPEPPDPFTMVKTYPKVSFNEALELTAVPGKKQWLVAERHGKVYALDMDPAKAEKKLVLDIGRTVYGLVPHPKLVAKQLLITLMKLKKPCAVQIWFS